MSPKPIRVETQQNDTFLHKTHKQTEPQGQALGQPPEQPRLGLKMSPRPIRVETQQNAIF